MDESGNFRKLSAIFKQNLLDSMTQQTQCHLQVIKGEMKLRKILMKPVCNSTTTAMWTYFDKHPNCLHPGRKSVADIHRDKSSSSQTCLLAGVFRESRYSLDT